MEASAGVGCYCKSCKPAMQDEQQIKYVVEKIKSKEGKIKPKTRCNQYV
jgi:hypothetical protein